MSGRETPRARRYDNTGAALRLLKVPQKGNKMEVIRLELDDGSGEKFDAALRGTLKDAADLAIITKDAGTEEGNPIAMLTFSVQIGGGDEARMARVQTVCSVKHLISVGKALDAKYPDLMK